MRFFEFFDKLDKITINERNIKPIIEKPRNCEEKYTDVKEYKRQYYLKNIEIYRERNRNYRLNKKNNINNNI